MWQELTKNENPMLYADALYLYNPISKKFEEEERGKMHTSIEDVCEMAKNLKPESEKTEEVIIKGVLVAGASSSQYFIKDKDGNVIFINNGTYAQLGDIVIARGVAMTSYGGNVYFTTMNSSSGWYIYGPSQDKLTYPTPLVFNGDEYIDEVRTNSNVLNSQYIMIQNVTLIKENELETQNKQYLTFDGSGVDSSMFGKQVNIYGYLNPFGRFVYTSIELIK